MTEDEMLRWHHWLNGHESEQALVGGEGQGCLEYLPQSLGLESWTRPSDCTKTTKAY